MTGRKPLIVGNWKMNKTFAQSISTAAELSRLCGAADFCDLAIAPVFTAIKSVADVLRGSNVKVAAQTCAAQIEHGAFTGEVAASMLAEIGAEMVLAGHSERRQFYNETNQIVNEKVKAVLHSGLTAILCVGETLSEHEAGMTATVVSNQLLEGLNDLTSANANNIIIAYEPVWAIGTGKVATPQQAQEIHGLIRQDLATSFPNLSEAKILYGGSVNAENIEILMRERDVDGALVGGASLDAERFANLIYKCNF
ncbi:MAG: triose-phosphate isomerase [Pyrinomonadaceae bacterium]|nr:triose-phosphate isomerase [Pyrinomonadaceae bacterium]